MHIQVYMQKSVNALVVIQVKHTTVHQVGVMTTSASQVRKENTASAVYTVVDQEQYAATKCK